MQTWKALRQEQVEEFYGYSYWTEREEFANERLRAAGIKLEADELRHFFLANIAADKALDHEKDNLLSAALLALDDCLVRKGRNMPRANMSRERLDELLLDETYRDYPDPDTLRALVKAGANPNAQDARGTAFAHIVHCNVNEASLELLALGAQILDTEFFELAGRLKNRQEARLLLQAKPSLKAVDASGETVIACCIRMRAPLEVTIELLEAGAAFDFVDGMGRSPLHIAIHADCPEYLAFFLDRGLDPRQVDGKNRSPLVYAIELRNTSAIELLAERKVFISETDPATGKPISERLYGMHAYEIDELLGKGKPGDFVIDIPTIDRQIAALKEQIKEAVLAGKKLGGADKDRERVLYHRDGLFYRVYTENETGDTSTDTIPSLDSFLQWLYSDSQSFGMKELDVWKDVLRRLH